MSSMKQEHTTPYTPLCVQIYIVSFMFDESARGEDTRLYRLYVSPTAKHKTISITSNSSDDDDVGGSGCDVVFELYGLVKNHRPFPPLIHADIFVFLSSPCSLRPPVWRWPLLVRS